MTLDEALATARREAEIVEKVGGTYQPRAVVAVVDAIAKAAEPFLTWYSESDAMLACGRSKEWLRTRFARWERQGVARKVGQHRQYLAIILPMREHQAA